MFKKYLILFLVSMIPMVELRGAVIMAAGMDIPAVPALLVCMFGNMIPVPFIYFFARKVLVWGADKKYIGKIFRFCLEKGEHGGQKLVAKTGRGGLFVALLLFVGIPLPGTGAWTGTLAASFLNMGIKSTVAAVSLGVAMAATIMYLISAGAFAVFGIVRRRDPLYQGLRGRNRPCLPGYCSPRTYPHSGDSQDPYPLC